MKGKTIITVAQGESASVEYAFPGFYPTFDLQGGTVDLNREDDDTVSDTLDLATLRNVIYIPTPAVRQ